MSANIEELARKHRRAFSGDVRGLRNALTEQAEAFKGEIQAYDGTVRELTKTVEDMRAALSVPVVGEPVAWVNAVKLLKVRKGYLLNVYLHGESGREIDNLVALYLAPTHSITASELATLREKEKDRDALLLMLEQVEQERDELRNDAERLQFMIDETAILMYSVGIDRTLCRVEWPLTGYVQDAFYLSERAAIDAAIAQGKGE